MAPKHHVCVKWINSEPGKQLSLLACLYFTLFSINTHTFLRAPSLLLTRQSAAQCVDLPITTWLQDQVFCTSSRMIFWNLGPRSDSNPLQSPQFSEGRTMRPKTTSSLPHSLCWGATFIINKLPCYSILHYSPIKIRWHLARGLT